MKIRKLLDEDLTRGQKLELLNHIADSLYDCKDSGVCIFSDSSVASAAREQFSIKYIAWSITLDVEENTTKSKIDKGFWI